VPTNRAGQLKLGATLAATLVVVGYRGQAIRTELLATVWAQIGFASQGLPTLLAISLRRYGRTGDRRLFAATGTVTLILR
jgi:hypothetical protein